MRGPRICRWCPDRSNCNHWSLEAAVLSNNPNFYTDQCEFISVDVYITLQLVIRQIDLYNAHFDFNCCRGGGNHYWGVYCRRGYRFYIWWRSTTSCMMTSSSGNIFRVTGPLCGEFTGPGEFPTQRPVTRSFDVFFELRLNKRLSKQPWGWWFETSSWSLWRQCNVSRLLGHLSTVLTQDEGPHKDYAFHTWVMSFYFT